MKFYSFFLISGLLLLSSCSGADENAEANTNEAQPLEECYYTINESSILVNWVAYKFTNKTPVEGTFNEVKINGMETLTSIEDLIGGLSFEIPIASINSNNPERDMKIQQTFFGNLKDTDVISGKVSSIEGDGLKLTLALNGMSKEVEGTWSMENGMFNFKANLDLKLFGASAAVDALNKLCYDLHIGPDGVSKLWDEVEIRFQCSIKEAC